MEIKKELKKIPEGCIEIPLEEVDYIYQPPQSHTPVIVMKQKLPPMQSRVLECMKCGSKKNLNTNKDKSFVECDECMWDLKSKPEKQENCREKWIRHFKKIEHLLQLGAELGISKEIEDFLSELLKREKPILQMMSDKTFSKEELKVIEEWYDGMLYPSAPDENDKLVYEKTKMVENKANQLVDRLSKLSNEKENE